MFSLIQEDWSVAVRQIEEFDHSVDGMYLANDVKEVQRLVARSSDSSKNICFVMPRPFSLVHHTPAKIFLSAIRARQTAAVRTWITSKPHY